MKPERFKKIRNEMGLTGEQLAEILHVNPATLRKYEMQPNRATHLAVPPLIADIMEQPVILKLLMSKR